MRTLNLILAATVAGLVGASQTANAIPVEYNGNLYEVISNPRIAWESANSAVPAGWHLVTITTAAEDAFVLSLATTSEGVREYWAGGYQPAGELVADANWAWVTGETWSYARWSNGEPNDNTGPGSEQYLGVYLGAAADGRPGWNDEGALGNIAGYIIELDRGTGVPEGGSTLMLVGLALSGLAVLRRKG